MVAVNYDGTYDLQLSDSEGTVKSLGFTWFGVFGICFSSNISWYIMICIYIYMHVYIYVCMYIYICIFIYIYIEMYMYFYLFIYLCFLFNYLLFIYLFVCLFVCIYMCVFIYVCIFIYVYLYICVYIYMYIYTTRYIMIYLIYLGLYGDLSQLYHRRIRPYKIVSVWYGNDYSDQHGDKPEKHQLKLVALIFRKNKWCTATTCPKSAGILRAVGWQQTGTTWGISNAISWP